MDGAQDMEPINPKSPRHYRHDKIAKTSNEF